MRRGHCSSHCSDSNPFQVSPVLIMSRPLIRLDLVCSTWLVLSARCPNCIICLIRKMDFQQWLFHLEVNKRFFPEKESFAFKIENERESDHYCYYEAHTEPSILIRHKRSDKSLINSSTQEREGRERKREKTRFLTKNGEIFLGNVMVKVFGRVIFEFDPGSGFRSKTRTRVSSKSGPGYFSKHKNCETKNKMPFLSRRTGGEIWPNTECRKRKLFH